jgi:hypothetical protein
VVGRRFQAAGILEDVDWSTTAWRRQAKVRLAAAYQILYQIFDRKAAAANQDGLRKPSRHMACGTNNGVPTTSRRLQMKRLAMYSQAVFSLSSYVELGLQSEGCIGFSVESWMHPDRSRPPLAKHFIHGVGP